MHDRKPIHPACPPARGPIRPADPPGTSLTSAEDESAMIGVAGVNAKSPKYPWRGQSNDRAEPAIPPKPPPRESHGTVTNRHLPDPRRESDAHRTPEARDPRGASG